MAFETAGLGETSEGEHGQEDESVGPSVGPGAAAVECHAGLLASAQEIHCFAVLEAASPKPRCLVKLAGIRGSGERGSIQGKGQTVVP